MKQPSDSLLPLHPSQYNVDKRLKYLLSQIIAQVDVDVVCIYTVMREPSMTDILLLEAVEGIAEPEAAIPAAWLQAELDQLTPSNTVRSLRLDPETAGDSSLRTVLLWPLTIYDRAIGAVILFSGRPEKYTQDDIDIVSPLIDLVQTVTESQQLVERLITTEAIARNPSPRNIISIMRDFLFDVHISGCALALFGPIHPDRPNAPFEYAEVMGSWSRRMGSDVGLGLRFNLDDFQDVIDQLEHQKFISYTDIEGFSERLDHFLKMVLKVDNIQSVTLLALQSDKRRLGVLGIATDEPHEFTLQELRTYQILTEFLTMSTMASALRQQADFVQQGRAALLDAVTEGVVMVLPDEQSTVLTINDQFTKMFDVREKDVQGVSLHDLLEQMRIPSAVRRDLGKLWLHSPGAQPEMLQGDFRMLGPEGTTCDMKWHSAPVHHTGKVIGRIYTFLDVSSARVGERLRYELLSRISHELRTPLTSISGFAEFILEATGDDLPPLAREYTGIILKSARHLNHIFTDMIEISRANAGELKLQRAEAHLPDVVIEVVARMEPQCKAREQTIVMDLNDDMPLLSFDIDRVDQVLTNLISNAIKYSPEGGQIRVKAGYAPNQKSLPNSAPSDVFVPCALVTIIDEGEGLTKEDADKIFLPFYRTTAARIGKVEGAGLGLAICTSIIDLHRGSIWAQAATRNAPGGCFYFTLPL